LFRLSIERRSWLTDHNLGKAIIEDVMPALLQREPEELERSSLTPAERVVTRSRYLATLARVCSAGTSLLGAELVARAALNVVKAAVGLLEEIELASKTHGELHPFVSYHVVRAVRASQPFLVSNLHDKTEGLTLRIAEALRGAIERLLALKEMRLLGPSEAIALGFCAAAMGLLERPSDVPFIIPALIAALDAQDASGCWPMGRVVAEDKDLTAPRLEMPTYEIAWALADTLLALTSAHRERLNTAPLERAVARLLTAGRYAEASVIQLAGSRSPVRGWCSDHPYGSPMIESWTSATVLQSALSLLGLIDEFNHQCTLETFTVKDPRADGWPDWMRWDTYRVESEPNAARPVLQYLEHHIVAPILASPLRLPSSERRTVSIVLFGPPGTSKTTAILALADGLQWPVVMLSPGDFIMRGLELVEAQAISVFERLGRLQRAVVLFDECDELFRSRRPKESSEQMRGITAFLTASMLPKLQQLHDTGRVVFAVCTNLIESLDPAIRRSGRMDHVLGLGPPDPQCRARLLQAAAANAPARQFVTEASSELASVSERFLPKELLMAMEVLLAKPEWPSASAARAAAREVADKMREVLTITEEDLAQFKKEQKRYSHA